MSSSGSYYRGQSSRRRRTGTERQTEYIRQLEEQNRIKKEQDSLEYTSRTRKMKERERNFNVFLGGANQERADRINKKLKSKAVARKHSTKSERRRWHSGKSTQRDSYSTFAPSSDEDYFDEDPEESSVASFAPTQRKRRRWDSRVSSRNRVSSNYDDSFESSNDDGEPGDESLLDETVVSKTKYPPTKHSKVVQVAAASPQRSPAEALPGIRYDGETTVEVDEVDTEGEELSRTDSLVLASVSKADPVATSFASGYELSFEADTDDKSTPRAPKQQHNAEGHGEAEGDGEDDTDADIQTLLALVDKLYRKNKLDKSIVEALRSQLNADPPARSPHPPSKAPASTEKRSLHIHRSKTPHLTNAVPLSPAATKAARAAASRRSRLRSSGRTPSSANAPTPHSRHRQTPTSRRVPVEKDRAPQTHPLPKAVATAEGGGVGPNNIGVSPAQCEAACALHLQLLSVWDGVRSHGEDVVAGLTQIQVYDTVGELMEIFPDAISVSAPEGCDAAPTHTLVDGCVHTTNPQHMWTCPIPATISIRFPGSVGITKIRIWNYNHSTVSVMDRRCVKRAAVTLEMQGGQQQLAWRGEVQRGCGNKRWTYFEEVELCKPQVYTRSPIPSNSPKRATLEATPSAPPISSPSPTTEGQQKSSSVRVSSFGRRLQICHGGDGGMKVVQQQRGDVHASMSATMNDDQRASVQKLLDSKMDWLPSQSSVKRDDTTEKAKPKLDHKADSRARIQHPSVPASNDSESDLRVHHAALEKLELQLSKPTSAASTSKDPKQSDADIEATKPSRRRRLRRARSRRTDSARSRPTDSARSRPTDSARSRPTDSARSRRTDSARSRPTDSDKDGRSTRGSRRKSRRKRWVVIDDDAEEEEATASVTRSVSSSSSRRSRARTGRRRRRSRKETTSPHVHDKLEAALSIDHSRKTAETFPASPTPATAATQVDASNDQINERPGSSSVRYPSNPVKRKQKQPRNDTSEKSASVQPSDQPSQKQHLTEVKTKPPANDVSWNPFDTRSSLNAMASAQHTVMRTISDTMMMTAANADKPDHNTTLGTPVKAKALLASTSASLANDTDTKPDPVALDAPPRGQVLRIVVNSSWSDSNRVGLNGIEVYDEEGDVVSFPEPAAQISSRLLSRTGATPCGPTDGHSRLCNLLDGVNFTMDATHMWDTHWVPASQAVELTLDLRREVELGFICLWNYNHSRVDAALGTKNAHISLDGKPIWAGQVSQAAGSLSSPVECCEVLSFTRDPYVMKRVQRSAPFHTIPVFKHVLGTDNLQQSSANAAASVADGGKKVDFAGSSTLDPFTVSVVQETMQKLRQSLGSAEFLSENDPDQASSDSDYDHSSPTACSSASGALEAPVGRVLTLDFRTTWGDPYYLGLTGLSVTVRVPGETESLVLPLDVSMMKADPPDINCMGEGMQDIRTLDKLVDGVNDTTDQEHMWLIPFTPGAHHTLDIHMPRKYEVLALTVWNYNKTDEDTYRGAKRVDIRVDGALVSPPSGASICKAPGQKWYKFGHTLDLARMHKSPSLWQPLHPPLDAGPPRVTQDYETAIHPHGLAFKLVLTNSWTDPYYVGLNGVEFFAIHADTHEVFQVHPASVDALPRDINAGDKDSGKQDCRVPLNLIDGKNTGVDGRHSWLAPRAASLPENLGVNAAAANEIVFLFNEPICLVAMKIWNYNKTPGRGACEVQVWADDILILMSELQMASSPKAMTATPSRASLSRSKGHVAPIDSASGGGQSFLFSDDPAVIRRFVKTVHCSGRREQDVTCWDEGVIISQPRVAQVLIYRYSDMDVHACVY